MSRFCPLFSSSKGNCSYLSGGGTTLLVDVGVSFRMLACALSEHNLSVDMCSGILITHEHTDHIKGLTTLLKRHALPVYASPETLDYLVQKDYIPDGAQLYDVQSVFTIDGIKVTPFDTPHDAIHSMGYKFEMPDQRKIAIATDLGFVTDLIHNQLTGCDLVMLESNYDQGMLECSAYPYSLKRRIKGNYGHLSNVDCSAECSRLIESGTTRLVLGHLSENNNQPDLARQVTKSVLDQSQAKEDQDYTLAVAPARGTSPCIVF